MAETDNLPQVSQERRADRITDTQGGRSRSRVRLACHRCQKRKIRCNGAVPACSNCRAANALCTDGASLRAKELPRAHIIGLQNRIAWLESLLKARDPDINLSQSPSSNAPGPEAEGGLSGSQAQSPLGADDANDAAAEAVGEGGGTSQAAPLNSLPKVCDLDKDLEGWRGAAHQIGLIALGGGQDARYIGPSSGYLLARVLLQSSDRAGDGLAPTYFSPSRPDGRLPLPCELVASMQRPLPLPSTKTAALYLCSAYFEFIGSQYPFLHRPTFLAMLNQMYESDQPEPHVAFQVFMVLAIGATVSSRRYRSDMLSDSYGIAALRYLDQVHVENSIQGLQCLLLLLFYAMHNPSARLNIWYLNYQCIAALLDLGLQRDLRGVPEVSLLEQEMRTRIFWCVYSLDRTIATIMGRPIGLRDEACELRVPLDISDDALGMNEPREAQGGTSDMRFALHLFALAKINSEIKYVANSIVRDTPSYALPRALDIHAWQNQVLARLDAWVDAIPPGTGNSDQADSYIRLICQLRYHNIRMLLMSPSPAIPNPQEPAWAKCYHSAVQAIRLNQTLYRREMLVASWTALHSIMTCSITMLYCLRVHARIALQEGLDAVANDISTSLSLLSAIGEHWPVARRARDIIDKQGGLTLRRLRERFTGHHTQVARTEASNAVSNQDTSLVASDSSTGHHPSMPQFDTIAASGSGGLWDPCGDDSQADPATELQTILGQFFSPNLFGETGVVEGNVNQFFFEDCIP